MKKNALLLFVVPLLLMGCENQKEERISSRKLYYLDSNTGSVTSDNIDILYKANSVTPYINLKYGVSILSSLRKGRISSITKKDAYVSLNTNNDVITLSNEANYTAIIDMNKQTISFEHYDEFFNASARYKPSTVVEPGIDAKSYTISGEQTYTTGNAVTLDLKKYSKLDIYRHNEDYYLPLQVFSDVFLGAPYGINLSYNMQDVFVLTGDVSLVNNENGNLEYTNYGKIYYGATKAKKVSAEYAKYFYEAQCFDLDYFYGLKSLKNIDNFDSYFSSKGYKDDMLSGDVHKMDNATAYALSTLEDGHTAETLTSTLYDVSENTIDNSKMDKKLSTWEADKDKFIAQKAKANIKTGLEVIDNTAFITFDSFSSIDENTLYKSSYSEEEITTQTGVLFADSYDKITKNKDVKYVVVDLSANTGGDSESLNYSLGILFGNVTINNFNSLSNSKLTTSYRFDINRDGTIDENDKSLSELGYKIIFLDSEFSFSCGNAMPVFAKAINEDVVTIGENTAGGTCSVRSTYNSLGSSVAHSSNLVLSIVENDEYIDIEKGAAADYSLSKEDMLNRTKIVENIKNIFEAK